MKQNFTNRSFVLMGLLSGFCVIWLVPLPSSPPTPPVIRVRYQYEAFPWPEGTLTATFYRVIEPHKVTVDHAVKRDEILEWAKRVVGYDYCGTVGDTIVLRRLEPADEPKAGEYSPDFTVKPDALGR